jgi:hypothetical protein
VPHDGSAASIVVPAYGLPGSLSFDAAGDLDVLYSYPGAITVFPPGGGSSYSVPFSAPDQLEDAEFLTPAMGGQSALFGDPVDGNFLLLNGTQAALSFPATQSGSQSSPMTGDVLNIGNVPLTLGNPAYSESGQSADFPIQSSTTCSNSLVLDPAVNCGITALFGPSASGSFAATLALSTNGFTSGPVSVSLTGTAGAGSNFATAAQPMSGPPSSPRRVVKNGALVHCRRCVR